jgi:hypothetical protein
VITHNAQALVSEAITRAECEVALRWLRSSETLYVDSALPLYMLVR